VRFATTAGTQEYYPTPGIISKNFGSPVNLGKALLRFFASLTMTASLSSGREIIKGKLRQETQIAVFLKIFRFLPPQLSLAAPAGYHSTKINFPRI
jgi:hypothetical protein